MKTAIIAGEGKFPELAARTLLKSGADIIVIAFKESAETDTLKKLIPKVFVMDIFKTGKILKLLKNEKVTHALLIGKVHKNILEKKSRPDLITMFLLYKLKSRSDSSIFSLIEDVLKKKGITTLYQAEALKDCAIMPGIYSKIKPDAETLRDIELGKAAAAALGGLDIGQTVVVKDGKVAALESMEGTDLTIARGCTLAGSGATIVKAPKPNQDERYDLPAAGLKTLETIKQHNGKALAVEAYKTLIADIDECIRYADEHGLIFMAYEKS